jgi:hypothetical protein
MALLTIAHVEKGTEGPGWYVLDHGKPVWGPYDSEPDAAWAKREHERIRVGATLQVNGCTVWIADTVEANERGYLVIVDDEKIEPSHPSLAAAQDHLRGVVEEIQEGSQARRTPKRMAPSIPPSQVAQPARKSS